MTTVALHYELSGDGDAPPVLLGGSLGTNMSMWAPQIAGLSHKLRLIPYDHRGHGRSPVPGGPYVIEDMGRDVLALMDTLGLERVSYCGLSIGGMVGIWLAENAPERIDRLVLLCTSAYAPPVSNWTDRARAVRAAGTPEVIADIVVSRWFTAHWAQENLSIVAHHRAMIADTDAEGYSSCCEAISTMDLRAGLKSIKTPTLVIGGAEDPALPPEHQRVIAAGIRGSRLEILEDAAHLASVQHPDTVNRLISEHLAG
jgi:3-oxoadipate enol-lactonase